MVQSQFPQPPSETLPTMYDLPSEDPEEPGLPDLFHLSQPRFLDETLRPAGAEQLEIFTASDLNVYYDPRHPLWYKRPDWFLVLGVAAAQRQDELRWSYVIWQEGVAPFLVVELLSPGTEDEDLGRKVRGLGKPPLKWEVYERILRVPFYVVYDRYENQLRVFQLCGNRYKAVELVEDRVWFEALQLGLGVWQGSYEGVEGRWLRWYDASGWVATPEEQERERAEQERERAEQERERAEQAEILLQEERERAERLRLRLRALGVDPEEV